MGCFYFWKGSSLISAYNCFNSEKQIKAQGKQGKKGSRPSVSYF